MKDRLCTSHIACMFSGGFMEVLNQQLGWINWYQIELTSITILFTDLDASIPGSSPLG